MGIYLLKYGIFRRHVWLLLQVFKCVAVIHGHRPGIAGFGAGNNVQQARLTCTVTGNKGNFLRLPEYK